MPTTWSVERLALLLRFACKNSGPWDDVEDDASLPNEGDAGLIVAQQVVAEAASVWRDARFPGAPSWKVGQVYPAEVALCRAIEALGAHKAR